MFARWLLANPYTKNALAPRRKSDDGTVAFRSSLPWPGNTLFDDPTAKVGVDLALLGPSDSLTQHRIRNPFLPGKALNHRDLKIRMVAP